MTRGGSPAVLRRLRSSFAFRLLAAGLVLALLVVGGISAFLLISRDRQTRGAALSNSDNRALVARQVLQQFTAVSSVAAGQQIANRPEVISALQSPGAGTALLQLFTATASAAASLPGEAFVIAGTDGRPLFQSAALTGAQLSTTTPLDSVAAALRGSPATGFELIGGVPAYDTAVPVRSFAGVVGVVVYLAPLGAQLQRLGAITQYPATFVSAAVPKQEFRTLGGRLQVGPTPADISEGVSERRDSVDGVYDAPLTGGGSGQVAGSFVAIAAPGSAQPAGYVGVEAPLSLFVGDQRGDELTIAALALLALLVTALAIFLFVERFVTKPVGRLEKGVARIAGGDLSSDIEVTSSDELGRLAGSVNHMRRQIASYVEEIEEARRRLDEAVDRLGSVSRALTTSGAGVDAQRQAVVEAAAALGHEGAAAVLCTREQDALAPKAAVGVTGGPPSIDAWGVKAELLAGRAVRVESAPEGWLAGTMVAVPMFYQDQVVGALAVISRAGHRIADSDAQALTVLANNAAIALENTRLFEQERETVRRLRELDTMKSNFLGTVQHELRTPLTVILGMTDLIELCWEGWDDEGKLGAMHDIQVSARILYDIVETMIDFSLLEAETLGLNPVQGPVRPVVEQAVSAVEERAKEGLAVDIDVDVPADLEVYADPDRFKQVMRAVLDNAVKFTPAGGHVQVRAEGNGHAGFVCLEVVDDGIGISDEAKPRIFERFYQADSSATRKYGGTGMGLALVLRLVEAHGATVEVESEEGHGTRLSLLWPAAAAAAAGEARHIAEQRGEA
ncbi:MAG: HAMP domain-containing protein [Chloroflexi bacterium]|nr:MAG: HAMP domain-containing protein [Chloroflexota bacterium]